MKIETTSHGDIIIINAPVELDIVMTEFKETIDDFLEHSRVKIAIDMSKTSFINSIAIGIIANYTHLARNKGGDIVLLNPSKGVKKILNLAGLGKNINIFENIEQAESFFNSLKG